MFQGHVNLSFKPCAEVEFALMQQGQQNPVSDFYKLIKSRAS